MIVLTSASVFHFFMIYIVPTERQIQLDRGTEIPDLLRVAINVSDHMVSYWYLWAIALAGGLGLIEWKCKSENKARIRTVIGVGASLVSIVFAFCVVMTTRSAILLIIEFLFSA